MNELDLARAIATGEAPSPSPSASHLLWSLRITGTGRAERLGRNEVVWRDPGVWLTTETLARCSGLPVLLQHPTNHILTSQEFADRAVGNVLYPYVSSQAGVQNDSGPDLWCVARIYDNATNELLQQQTLSTSPSVTFRPSDGNETIPTASGHILLEGDPSHICHIAIVLGGVWDRGGEPSGIRNDLLKENNAVADAQDDPDAGENPATPAKLSEGAPTFDGEKLDKLLSHIDDLGKRLDSMSEEMFADRKRRADAEAKPEPRVAADSQPTGMTHSQRLAQEEADRAGFGDAQARADAVMMGFGLRAPVAMAGERRLDYRARLARHMQKWSKEFAAVDLNRLKDNPDAFSAIEDRIYSDADVAARSPDSFIIPGGGLREITRVDPASGQRITSFYGNETFIGLMKRPSRRVIGINTKAAAQ